MSVDINRIRRRVREFDLRGLFIEELGWDYDRAKSFEAEGWTLRPIAQKRGFRVFHCASPDDDMPDRAMRQKIDGQVAKNVALEHLIVYTDAGNTQQVWQWALRQPETPVKYFTDRYEAGQSGQRLAEKLQRLHVSIDDEDRLTIIDVSQRAAQAFRRDKVTKKFYDRFAKEREELLPKIEGIPVEDDRDWYASIMLNRLMFVYFVQQKGFLNNDPHYLQTKLREVQQRQGRDQFYSFYREFLLKLFHEGLATQPPRPPEIEALLGDVPYLNGGIFDQHQIELNHPDIQIPDSAFERLFDFFDDYQWHLDDRPLRKDDEINPDVLGYIFEKYVNQKQMGAYYTKEDITEYISKNTIVPFLFDAAKKDCAIAFEPGSALWGLLQTDPDRYIYDAVRKGVEVPLPAEIAAGVKDVAQRGGWNRPAGEDYALPTETWREHVARRQRYEDIWQKLVGGEVSSIDDLITYNLNIRQFAQDVIHHAEGPELVRAFFKAIANVSVLDPTCGSGAFLFAALNILAPLYDACLERMEELVAELDRSAEAHRPEKYKDFRATLAEVEKHASRNYYIFKSIIIQNLYGVDIMEEAVEICKLRLFLKLASELEAGQTPEPLPDIDFNIRAGNTLVGFATMDEVRKAAAMDARGNMRLPMPEDEAAMRQLEERAELADRAYRQFREQQTTWGGQIGPRAKLDLRDRLRDLSAELDRYLARLYGIHPESSRSPLEYEQRFNQWRASHQPFHWLVDFYGLMHRGGFDVIIGNPPYVSVRKISYLKPSNNTSRYSDIYAYVVMRCLELAGSRGRCGMIVPLSLTFSEDFGYLRSSLSEWGRGWYSSYDNIPAALFSGVSQRCTIWLGSHGESQMFVGPMHRWRAKYRPSLLSTITYTPIAVTHVHTFGIPKVAGATLQDILTRQRLYARPGPLYTRDDPLATHRLMFAPSARNFMSVYAERPPTLGVVSLDRTSSKSPGVLRFRSSDTRFAALASTLGETGFWYWLTRGDGFDVTGWLLSDFLMALNAVPAEHCALLCQLGELLHERRFEALVFKKNAGKFVGNFNYRGMPEVTRRADLVLLAGLGASRDEAEELFDYVQRTLAINEQAGEKGIPDSIKAMFPPLPVDEDRHRSVFRDADELIQQHYGFTDEELDFIINYDIKYRMGRAGLAAGGDAGGDE